MSNEPYTFTVRTPAEPATLTIKQSVPIEKRFPWGLLLWWFVSVFILPVAVPAVIATLVLFFHKAPSANGLVEIIKQGELLLAITVLACAVAFDAIVLKTRKAKSQFADVALIINLLIAGAVLLFLGLYKSSGSGESLGSLFVWSNIGLYLLCGIFALCLRWGDMREAVNHQE